MDLLHSYHSDSEEETEGVDGKQMRTAPTLPSVDLAPAVPIDMSSRSAVQIFDPKTKELVVNAKYEELFLPEVCS